MTPIARAERVQRHTRSVARDNFNDGRTVRWLRPLHANAPDRMARYYKWTRYVENEVHDGRILL